ncbi:MAG: 4Fe-4S binding protein [Ignavibacteriae bacterium]|nr:4Fe-4S binding protein [Ignavibacteriota bacterium]
MMGSESIDIVQSKQRTVVKKKSKFVALIEEETCTGCEVCIEFCPVDCIVVVFNPNPELHTYVCRVIEEPCTGCTLCVKECPWECIAMVPRTII